MQCSMCDQDAAANKRSPPRDIRSRRAHYGDAALSCTALEAFGAGTADRAYLTARPEPSPNGLPRQPDRSTDRQTSLRQCAGGPLDPTGLGRPLVVHRAVLPSSRATNDAPFARCAARGSRFVGIADMAHRRASVSHKPRVPATSVISRPPQLKSGLLQCNVAAERRPTPQGRRPSLPGTLAPRSRNPPVARDVGADQLRASLTRPSLQ